MTRSIDVDIAIVGSGFAGALCALALRQRGRRVALVERGRHPRFAIGESTTPLTNLLLEELADRYDLPQVRSFSKWGTWRRTHPDVACGLKRGFTFLFHQHGERFVDDGSHARQLLVAASPNDEVADTHWYRPAFDLALVEEAQSAGAIYLDETHLERIGETASGMTLEGTRDGQAVTIAAGFVIDASGPRGFLTTAFGTGNAPLRWLPRDAGPLHALRECRPLERHRAHGRHASVPAGRGGAPSRVSRRLDLGAALQQRNHERRRRAHGWTRSRPSSFGRRACVGSPARAPAVGSRSVRPARATLPFIHTPRVAFRCHEVAGAKWALLPSAAGVIDPLLSTGFPLTLLGLSRLLEVLETTSPGAEREAALKTYAETTQRELDITEQLVGALYACMVDPPLFKRLSLLYFAAASYSETVRRLGRPQLAPGFLLNAHPQFGVELRECAAAAAAAPSGERRTLLVERIDRAIEPFDTAGLLDRSRRDWYPVLADDLISSAAKLEASADDVNRLLLRCGLVGA